MFELADVTAQPLVEEIDDSANARGVAAALVGEEPELAAVVAARRQAAHEVGIRVGDDAWQYGNSEARTDPGQQAARSRVMHRDLLFETQRLSQA